MALLSGRVDVSGYSAARVPVRVETSDGVLAALTTAESDGTWEVDVPAGDYVVRPHGLPAHPAVAGLEGADSATAQVPEGSVAAARRARRGERS